MRVKVCGITQLKQLQQLDGLNIEFAGLIFVKDSPRYMGETLDAAAVKNADFDFFFTKIRFLGQIFFIF